MDNSEYFKFRKKQKEKLSNLISEIEKNPPIPLTYEDFFFNKMRHYLSISFHISDKQWALLNKIKNRPKDVEIGKAKRKWSRSKSQCIPGRNKQNFFRTIEWRALRAKTLTRYGRVCMHCGDDSPDTIFHVDHIKPRSKYPRLELDPDNLQVLCRGCNLSKSNLYETDLRPKED